MKNQAIFDEGQKTGGGPPQEGGGSTRSAFLKFSKNDALYMVQNVQVFLAKTHPFRALRFAHFPYTPLQDPKFGLFLSGLRFRGGVFQPIAKCRLKKSVVEPQCSATKSSNISISRPFLIRFLEFSLLRGCLLINSYVIDVRALYTISAPTSITCIHGLH